MVAAAIVSPIGGALFWVLGGFIAACGAACYAECGSRLPQAGGFYVTYRTVYGPALAFVGGWVAVVVTYPASTAAIALVFGSYLGEVIPALAGHETLAAAGAVVASAVINIAGVPLAAGVQRLLSGTKLLALAVICLAAVVAAGAIGGGTEGGAPATGAGAGDAAGVPESPAPPGEGGTTGGAGDATGTGGLFGAALIAALMVMLFTYDGWSDISLIAGEVKNAGRVLGPAVLAASAAIVLVYAAVQWSVMTLLPDGRAAGAERVVADAAMAGLGPGAGRIVALLVAISAFGSVHSIVLGASRIGYAMARDGNFFSWLAAVAPRLETPARSIACLAGVTLIYVFAAGFRNLLALFTFSVWIFYSLTAVALLILRQRGVGGTGTWRAPGGVTAPLVVILTGIFMTTGLVRHDPRQSAIGLALLLAGFAVFHAWRRMRGAAAAPA